MFFSNRIISRWNNLPKAVVNLNTINAFKNSIDMIFNNIMYDTNIDIYYDFWSLLSILTTNTSPPVVDKYERIALIPFGQMLKSL